MAAMIVILLLLMLPAPLLAQQSPTSFSQFRILLKSGERITGVNATLTPDSLYGQSGDRPVAFQRRTIRALDVASGTNAGKGAAIGAGIGLLTGLLAIAQVGIDDTRTLNSDAAIGVTAGLTAGGALIGGIVGAGRPRWRAIPIETAEARSNDLGLYLFLSVHI